MPAYTNPKRIFKYSNEFKLKAVQWSFDPQRSVKDVPAALHIYPFMLSRWRKEFREGKYGPMKSTTKSAKPNAQLKELDELKKLRKRIAELEEENDILKKWQRFQAEERRKSSGS